MTNLDSILKSRDITLPTRVSLVKAMVFPVVMYGCESWTIKKAKRWRIGAFKLWCWRRLLRVPCTAGRSNQSILMKSVLNVHWKDWCWSWSSNTLATWCEQLTHWKRPWCRERLNADGEGDDRAWDGWTGREFELTPGVGDGWGGPVCCSPWGHKESDTTERLSWTVHIFPGEGNVNPLQYSCLDNPMDRGAWCATVHGVSRSFTWLSN